MGRKSQILENVRPIPGRFHELRGLLWPGPALPGSAAAHDVEQWPMPPGEIYGQIMGYWRKSTGIHEEIYRKTMENDGKMSDISDIYDWTMKNMDFMGFCRIRIYIYIYTHTYTYTYTYTYTCTNIYIYISWYIYIYIYIYIDIWDIHYMPIPSLTLRFEAT